MHELLAEAVSQIQEDRGTECGRRANRGGYAALFGRMKKVGDGAA